jgi:hypothetical protein
MARNLSAAAALALAVALGASAQPASMTDPNSSITPAMRAAFEERMRLVEQYIGALDRGPDAAATTVSNVVWLREMLYTLPLESLRSLPAATSYAAASADVVRIRDAKPQLGSFSDELVYYPITPCRYIDTRASFGGAGPLAPSRTYDLAFTGGAYNGSVSCNPKAAVGGNEDRIAALAINVALIGTSTPTGLLGVGPPGQAAGTAFINWYVQGAGVQLSNAGVVTTSQDPAQAAEIEFALGAGSTSDIVVDVFGVFAAPTATQPDCVNGGFAQATPNTTTRDFNLTVSSCPTGYRATSVRCNASAGDFTQGHLKLTEAGINNPGAVASCRGRYLGTTTVTVTAQLQCCRVPGR